MRFALLVTQGCNLRCSYCYIGKRPLTMSFDTARAAVDFAFERTPPGEPLEFGFFGGEPLLELPLVERVTELVEAHPEFDPRRVHFNVTTNGTVFTPRVEAWVKRHDVNFAISCDGQPKAHDAHRRFRNGRPTAARVARTVRRATERLSRVPVNAVFGPDTLAELPATVDYLASLGVRQIHLNPDIRAEWGPHDGRAAEEALERIGNRYVAFYRRGEPRFINLIDTKVAVILRGGYGPLERCRLGVGELAVAPDGSIYPCERLVGRNGGSHRIGHLDTGLRGPELGLRGPEPVCATPPREPGSDSLECLACGVRSYCANSCACTNFFSTGSYDRVGPFHCALERASLATAFRVIGVLERELGATFFDHVSGLPTTNSGWPLRSTATRRPREAPTHKEAVR